MRQRAERHGDRTGRETLARPPVARAAWPVWLLTIATASSARAIIDEGRTPTDEGEDLLDLAQRDDDSLATRESLMELHREGVDLNTASREQLHELPGLGYAEVDAILRYRQREGRVDVPAELVHAGILSEGQLLEAAPFLRLEPPGPRARISGQVRTSTHYTLGDGLAPPVLLSVRLRGPWGLSAGALLLTSRLALDRPTATPLDPRVLASSETGYRLHVPRFFLEWKLGKLELVAGTFALGFAERLTLDTTRRATPSGVTVTTDASRPFGLTAACRRSGAGVSASADPAALALCGDPERSVTPDYRSRELFRGLAASLGDVTVGREASVSLSAFISLQSRGVSQYEVYDRAACEDPRDDRDADCAGPPVILPDGSRASFSTLPAVFDELAGGGHLTLKPVSQFTVGATAYAALPMFDRTAPLQLDFQEWSRYPSGGAFGAAGLDASAALGPFNLFIEGTRTFNHAFGGGGWGVAQRTTWSGGRQALELSLRFYDAQFGHPYARPLSSPDAYDGQSARNEAGTRVRYLVRPSAAWRLRAWADVWVTPFAVPGVAPAGVTNLAALARLDFEGWTLFQPAVWVDVRNRNLGANERGPSCASGVATFDQGDPYRCSRDLYRVAAQLTLTPHRQYARFVLQSSLAWVDDARYVDRFRNDVMAWAELRSQPLDVLRVRLGSRYLNQAIDAPGYLEESLRTSLEVAWLPRAGAQLALRYEVLAWLDPRSSTTRVPNPEHHLALDARADF